MLLPFLTEGCARALTIVAAITAAFLALNANDEFAEDRRSKVALLIGTAGLVVVTPTFQQHVARGIFVHKRIYAPIPLLPQAIQFYVPKPTKSEPWRGNPSTTQENSSGTRRDGKGGFYGATICSILGVGGAFFALTNSNKQLSAHSGAPECTFTIVEAEDDNDWVFQDKVTNDNGNELGECYNHQRALLGSDNTYAFNGKQPNLNSEDGHPFFDDTGDWFPEHLDRFITPPHVNNPPPARKAPLESNVAQLNGEWDICSMEAIKWFVDADMESKGYSSTNDAEEDVAEFSIIKESLWEFFEATQIFRHVWFDLASAVIGTLHAVVFYVRVILQRVVRNPSHDATEFAMYMSTTDAMEGDPDDEDAAHRSSEDSVKESSGFSYGITPTRRSNVGTGVSIQATNNLIEQMSVNMEQTTSQSTSSRGRLDPRASVFLPRGGPTFLADDDSEDEAKDAEANSIPVWVAGNKKRAKKRRVRGRKRDGHRQ